jgi:hypothetical protein
MKFSQKSPLLSGLLHGAERFNDYLLDVPQQLRLIRLQRRR